jgi:hypothetical protein
VGDQVNRLAGQLAVEEAFQLARPVGHAPGRAQPGHADAVATRAQELRDAAEVAQHLPAAQADLVEAEQAVDQDDRRA